MNIARIALAGLVVIALTTAVACGNDDDGSGPTDLGSTPNVATSPTTNAEPESPAPDINVVATDFAFDVGTVEAGRTSFVLTNDGIEAHFLLVFKLAEGVTLARNLGHEITDFATVNMDFIQSYRPNTNVVQRPTTGVGRGYSLTGHHEIMVPLLAAALVEGVSA